MKNKFRIKKQIIPTILTIVLGISFFHIINIKSPSNKSNSNNQISTFDESTNGAYPNVGVGKQKWEDHFLAPFVDLAGWSAYKEEVAGVSPISIWQGQTDTNYFNLGFIDKTTQNAPGQESYDETNSPEITNGIIPWGWGGWGAYSRFGNPPTVDAHEAEIERQIGEVRKNGGDVTVSFGGANLTPFWSIPGVTEDQLVSTYESIIEGYSLTHIDLDIEGPIGEVLSTNQLNASAIKRVQDDTGVKVNLTLPVASSGLDYLGLPIFQAYLDAGVDVDVINIMAMLFGGDESAQVKSASEGLKKQIIEGYSKIGVTLTDEQAYEKIGITNSIDQEGSYHFSLEDANVVKDYVIDKDIGMMSMWNMNRDAHDSTGYTTSQPVWSYIKIFRNFTDHNDSGGDQTPPSIPSNIIKDGEPTTDTIGIKWDPSEDEAGGSGIKNYTLNIEDSDSSGGIYSESFTTDSTNYKFEGLEEDTKYDVKILATDVAGNSSDYSSVVNFQTAKSVNNPPDPITMLEQTPGSEDTTSLTVDWNSVTDPDGDPVHYMVQKDSDTAINVGTEVSYKFTGLNPGQNYKIKVWAEDDKNLAGTSKEQDFQTESGGGGDHPPTDISVSPKRPTPATSSSISLQWGQSTDEDGDEIHYIATINDSSSTELRIEQPTDPYADVYCTFDNLLSEHSYDMEVWAVDSNDNESRHETITYSTLKETPPPSPLLGLSVDSKDDKSINLSWQPSTIEGGFTVWYSIEVDGISKDTITETSYIAQDLSPLTTYTIVVTPQDSLGKKGTSDSVTVTTDSGSGNLPPTKVNENNFIQKSGTKAIDSLDLQWDPSTDPDGDSVSYILIIDKGPDSGNEIEEPATNHKFSNLLENTTYSITILAIDNNNNRSESTTKSFTTESSGENQPPTEVGNLRKNSITEKSLTVNWNPSTDPDGDELIYYIQINNEKEIEVGSYKYEYTFNNLNANTSYTINVWAVDSKFNEGPKSSIDIKTSPKSKEYKQAKTILATTVTTGAIITFLLIILLVI